MVPKSPGVVCKTVSGGMNDLGARHPRKYAHCKGLSLVQCWSGRRMLPGEKAVAYAGKNKTGLWFYACLEDSDIFSKSTTDDQKMWQLGDVVEFFVKPGVQRDDYWEIHVTPNDHLMDIHIASRDKLEAKKLTWKSMIAAQSKAKKQLVVDRDNNKWAVEIVVPWKTFGFTGVPPKGTVWQIAVCRYNLSRKARPKLELSATAHFTKLRFHRIEEFNNLYFR